MFEHWGSVFKKSDREFFLFPLNDLLIVFPTASFLQVQSLQGLDSDIALD